MAQSVSTQKAGPMLVNVQVNANDEIDLVPVNKSDGGGGGAGGRGSGSGDAEGYTEEDYEELSDNMDSDPDLVETKDGRLMLSPKRICCPKCKKLLRTAAEIEAHKPKCPGAVDKVTDVILKEMQAAKHANPGEEFHKYCNPNPEHPCYCCGEDVSTAHVGHIRCQFCPKSFKAYDYLERHLRSIHSESDEFPCSNCNAKCPTAAIQAEHLKTHLEGKPFACTACGKEFTRRYHLDRHVKHSNCGKDPKDVMACEVCGKEFTRVDNLREHLRTHLGQTGRKRDYQCPYCPKSFYGSSLLNIHIRTHTGEKPFPCDLCPKSFPSSGALRKHRRKHTGERPYQCDQCSASFAARETLNRHRKTHTGDKPHECTVCGKRFIQTTQLRTHMFVHTGKPGFRCQECGQEFAWRSRLTKHIKYDHRGEQPFECSECGKLFYQRSELVRHLTVHSSVKDFNCPICKNAYASKSSLYMHLRTHSKEQPVSCKVCMRSFVRADCLLRHMKKLHPEYLSELIEATEKRKEEELEMAKPSATVEINGEVYEITPVEEVPAESEGGGKGEQKPPAAASQMVELQPVLVKSSELPTDGTQHYELLPITEDTEDSEMVVTIEEEEEQVVESPARQSPRQVTKQPEKNAAAALVVAKRAAKPPAKKVVEAAKEPTRSTRNVKSSPAVVVVAAAAAAKATSPKVAETIVKPPNSVERRPPMKREPAKAPAAKATPPARATKAPANAGGESEESVKPRRKAREPKTSPGPGAKKRRLVEDDCIPIFLSDELLAEKISELLQMLIGEEMLQEFGWPDTPVDEVLCKVILRCGHQPTKGEEAGDQTTRMRENTKILFSVTMEDEDIKPLLNNHTVDEVIMHVLKSR